MLREKNPASRARLLDAESDVTPMIEAGSRSNSTCSSGFAIHTDSRQGSRQSSAVQMMSPSTTHLLVSETDASGSDDDDNHHHTMKEEGEGDEKSKETQSEGGQVGVGFIFSVVAMLYSKCCHKLLLKS